MAAPRDYAHLVSLRREMDLLDKAIAWKAGRAASSVQQRNEARAIQNRFLERVKVKEAQVTQHGYDFQRLQREREMLEKERARLHDEAVKRFGPNYWELGP